MSNKREQIQAQFPDATSQEATLAESDPDGFVRQYAQRTGQTEDQVRSTLEGTES